MPRPVRLRLLLPLLLAACAAPTGAMLPESAQDTTPLAADRARIAVFGLSCPNCATNVDLVLKRLPGVASVRVDLAAGHVDVGLAGPERPSPFDLATAVRDSGFTVLDVEARP